MSRSRLCAASKVKSHLVLQFPCIMKPNQHVPRDWLRSLSRLPSSAGAQRLNAVHVCIRGKKQNVFPRNLSLSFCVQLPYCGLPGPAKTLMTVMAISGAFTNPLAYAVMAAAGESNELLKAGNGGELMKMPLGPTSPVSEALLKATIVVIPATLMVRFSIDKN